MNEMTQEELNILERKMCIPVGKQIRFSGENDNLEKIYSFRQPFFSDPSLTADVLELIAKEYSYSGTEYVELSGSQIFDLDKEPQMLAEASKVITLLKEKYGVDIRFLGAMTRFDDPEWSLDQLEKLKKVANNPLIAGIDIVGHETNSTLDVVANIEPYMQFSKDNNLGWTFRFHAGENPAHPENVKEALKLADKYGVKIRIGHGLYGIDEETIALMHKTGAVIEINSSSNLSLNNITSMKEMNIVKLYIDNNIPIVLGTDGPGIYQTNPRQEASVSQHIFDLNGIDIEKARKSITQTEEKTIEDRKTQENLLKKKA